MRAGTGGGEAALWAADLLRMYNKYAATQNWKVSTLNLNEVEGGGLKEAVIQVASLNHLLYDITWGVEVNSLCLSGRTVLPGQLS